MAAQDIQSETVTYAADGTTLTGYAAYDRNVAGPRPGVIVISEWWGLTDYIMRRARMLAELGYTALAIDMYGDGKTADNPDDAGALMNGVLGNMDAGTARLRAGYAALADRSDTNAAKLAAIGYCFGGAMALHMARIGMPLAAVVSFHGALGSIHTPAPGGVKAKVLVCHGADDSFVPDEEVANFKREMETAGADCRFIAYDGAVHGFSNPEADENGRKYGLPLAYDADVDTRSWQEMRTLFDEVFA